jgi:hypothetical protein
LKRAGSMVAKRARFSALKRPRRRCERSHSARLKSVFDQPVESRLVPLPDRSDHGFVITVVPKKRDALVQAPAKGCRGFFIRTGSGFHQLPSSLIAEFTVAGHLLYSVSVLMRRHLPYGRPSLARSTESRHIYMMRLVARGANASTASILYPNVSRAARVTLATPWTVVRSVSGGSTAPPPGSTRLRGVDCREGMLRQEGLYPAYAPGSRPPIGCATVK